MQEVVPLLNTTTAFHSKHYDQCIIPLRGSREISMVAWGINCLCQSSDPHTLPVQGWPWIPRSDHNRSPMLRSSATGIACKRIESLQEPASKKKKMWQALCNLKKETSRAVRCAKRYTEMRFRKMIRSSGTPFLIRRSIAWFAELPTKQQSSSSIVGKVRWTSAICW